MFHRSAVPAKAGLLRCVVLVLSMSAAGRAAVSCEDLVKLSLPETTITSATAVPAGGYAVPASSPPAAANLVKSLPAFCLITAALKPSADSDIEIEVWLPASRWNGRFLATSAGGANAALQGEINQAAMAQALKQGYATGGTDLGHEGSTLSYAIEHPEKLVDFGYRAFHEMTVRAKAIVAAYYGSRPKFSYVNACAAGGRNGLMEAQRFPFDYDGIVVGAPANDWVHLQAWSLWVYASNHKDEASYIPPAKLPLIHQAALAVCDQRDGVADGVIEDPTRCQFDPKVLQCQAEDNETCLSAGQVETARKLYGPLLNPRTQHEIFPGMEPGSELGWRALADGEQPTNYIRETFKYLVFHEPSWDWRARPVDFDKDVNLGDKLDHGTITAANPNLKPFFDRGGKLIQYHGWSDALISPGESVEYYQRVAQAVGGREKLESSMRLYMVPGMGHCRGGEGTDSFDLQSAIEDWVEQDKAPGPIVAARITKGKTIRTRPLCPYPQIARYNGTGSTDEAANFTCIVP